MAWPKTTSGKKYFQHKGLCFSSGEARAGNEAETMLADIFLSLFLLTNDSYVTQEHLFKRVLLVLDGCSYMT